MTQHFLWMYGKIAISVSLSVGALAVWSPMASAQAPGIVNRPARPVSGSQPLAARTPTSTPPARSPKALTLQLAPAASIAPAESKSTRKGAAAQASRQPPRQRRRSNTRTQKTPGLTLDLSLPTGHAPVAAAGHAYSAPQDNATLDKAPDDAASQNPSANAQPQPAATDPAPSASRLFNPDNGLRGFMAQNWVNQRFGFQGGLAIKEGRLRRDTSNFEDNFAVGMGVLLAF